ncbi:MAG: class I SAM-dependent methyltransferase [Patescibacteria group bacterium]
MHRFTRGNGLLEDFLAKKRAEKANNLMPQNYRKGKILDIGCGSYPYFLINTNFNQKYGIDPSLKLSDIKNKQLNLQVLDVTGNKLPFADSYFDVVTMLAVFEHIDGDKLIPVLKEIYRVLKKDGMFIITTPAPWADKLLHQMSKIGLISSEEIHDHKHNHPRSKIENILQQGDFERHKIKSGYFEIYMNMWFTAVK